MSLPKTESGAAGRWIGLDYGVRRIGIALSDPDARIATPAGVCQACGDAGRDAHAVCRWAQGREPRGFVVGMPFNMDGSVGPQAERTQSFIDALAAAAGLPVEPYDERLSSFQADQYMREAGVKPRKQRTLRDALAAQVILQGFLDSRR